MNRRTAIVLVIILAAGLLLSSCFSTRDSTAPAGNNPQSPSVIPASLAIHTIQGSGHISPYNGQMVTNVKGIVTAIRNDGFYFQDTQPDDNLATSEALLVYTVTTPTVKIGDEVLVTGTVDEFYPGGVSTSNLTITEIKNPFIKTLASGRALPAPVVLGKGGRELPGQVIDDDRMEKFDPLLDGLDFFESLESMLVQVNQAVVVGPTNAYKEIAVLADSGWGAELRSPRGGIVLREKDFNPERILIDDLLTILPDVNVGDRFEQPLVGILDYNFGSFRVLPKQRPVATAGGLQPSVIPPSSAEEFSISGLNVQNLDPNDGQKRFDDLAGIIVKQLHSPDILTLGEIQDNNGPINDGTVDASETYRLIIRAIQRIGGPKYEYVDIPPEPNMDGGELGGNIRVGFLYRSDTGIVFNPVPGGGARNSVEVRQGKNGAELTSNPGRIDPLNDAFFESRKPLVAQFEVRGQRIFIIGLHLNSKSGDTALFGRFQPPQLTSEPQRLKQAEVVSRFIKKILEIDLNAKVIVLGDLNDFQFSPPVKKLQGDWLTNLVERLEPERQFSYIHEGNGQVLDHILVSQGLARITTFFDFLHLNSEFALTRRFSDHDPTLARFLLP